MLRLILLISSSLLIGFIFSQNRKDNPLPAYRAEYNQYDKLYHDAGTLSLQKNYSSQTEKLEQNLNRQALRGFLSILPAIEKDNNDSLAFHCYYKIGVLEHYFDSLSSAHDSYRKAIALKAKLPLLPDSFLFKAYLYSGILYYGKNQFDSAFSNYKKAEQISEKYQTSLEESNRLFNTLGALYYETGNYRQAKNYFEKAISIMHPAVPFYQSLLVNYKINLASTLTRLEEYDEANRIYQSLLPLNINRNEILHNIGAINLNLGAAARAIYYFKQVKYNSERDIRLYNDMGLAYFMAGKYDSAKIFYALALAENDKWNGKSKNVARGLTYKYMGDWLVQTGNYGQAVQQYQQAIIQFYSDFDSSDIYQNPVQYSGVFSYINLFTTLSAKADVLEKLYREQKAIPLLEAALNAYRSAFRLSDYVERTYDSDEARLFLNKIKYSVHNKPIDISLQLYKHTRMRSFLEDAYFFDQRNKASILSLNTQENEIRKMNAANPLFAEESAVKSAITRLSLKAALITDSQQLNQINAAIRDYEIRLGKLKDKIRNEPRFKAIEFTDRIPPVKNLQRMLGNNTAVLSYHVSDSSLLLFLIAANQLEYYQIPVNDIFFNRIDSFKQALHFLSNNKKYTGQALSAYLYDKLIRPAETNIAPMERLIIIPDDELNYLPFEALTDAHDKYLVEKFSIQYQYSTALLTLGEPVPQPLQTLAFAPFNTKEFHDSAGLRLEKLPSSGNEVNKLNGKIYTDSDATKVNFIRQAKRFPIIHLATHAEANNEAPLRSSILFYPDEINNPDHYRLYAQEIYSMDLDSVHLIILSACETGTGQLVRGEGLMSLSRAFAYAGCPNIITSLWKAEDKTTAYIAQKLHSYIEKGFTNDKALQQAKLDLLKDPDWDPRYKTPNYWAHLIYIGNYEPYHNSSDWWWIAVAIILITSIYIYKRIKA
jgi:CHAT domain-containing protein/Tfp pilus assembly protein PilF